MGWGPARHREPALPQARRAGKSPLSFCQLNTLHCPSEFNGAKQRTAFMSGGLNAGHNHSSPNGEGVWGTLYTLWLGGLFSTKWNFENRRIYTVLLGMALVP